MGQMPPDSAPVTSALRHGTPPCVSTLRPQPARRSASNAEAAGTGRGTAQGRLPAAQPAPGSPRLDALPLPPPALSGPLRSQRGAEPATSAASRGTGPATAPPPAAVPWGAAANSEAEAEGAAPASFAEASGTGRATARQRSDEIRAATWKHRPSSSQPRSVYARLRHCAPSPSPGLLIVS
mmetsp:Transcript_18796/g.48249  ORF Transcript_18796/g.48249 Transcript_18796/m.48249 type:complete len:181 (+) Transcript_18796:755-1297(+)